MSIKKFLLLFLALLSTSFILCVIGFFILEVELEDELGIFILNLVVVPLCIAFGVSIAQLFASIKEE